MRFEYPNPNFKLINVFVCCSFRGEHSFSFPTFPWVLKKKDTYDSTELYVVKQKRQFGICID